MAIGEATPMFIGGSPPTHFSRELNRERLTVLRDHMRQMQADRDAGKEPVRGFYMGDWIASRDFLTKETEEAVFNGWSCKTACCLLGEASFLPEFQAEGLQPSFLSNRDAFGDVLLMIDEQNFFVDADAGKEFFGLLGTEMVYLFIPSSYKVDVGPLFDGTSLRAAMITPRMAAKHIDEVLAGKFRA